MADRNEGPIILDAFRKIINEREKIWQKYDHTKSKVSELEHFSSTFDSPDRASAIGPLSSTNTPPDEITHALTQITQEDQNIKNAKAKIESYQNQIEEQKKGFRNFMIGVVVVLIIAAIIIFKTLGS